MRRILVLLALGVGAAGCSAQVDTTEIDPINPPAVVAGLPFRVAAPYDVVLWQHQPDGSYKEVYRERMQLPDPDHLYVLHYTGYPLASATSKITLNPDGTLSKVEVSDVKSEAPAAASAIAKQVEAVGSAKAAAAAAEAQRAATKDSDELAYAKALQAARDKADEVARIAPGDPQLPSAQRALAVLQIEANQAAEKAHHSPPFPGVRVPD